MSQMPGGPMGGDFGPIFSGPFGGRMRRMPFPPINRGTIFRPDRPRPPIYSPGGPNKGGTQAPIPRFPSRGSGASNFYRSPMYNPGVPSGLSALLSGRPSRFGRMTDPATGFPQRTSGKGGGSKGSARTVRPSEQEPVMDRQPRPDILQSVKIDPDILDRGTVMNPVYRSQGPESIQPVMNRQPQPAQIETPVPVRDFTGAPPPMMDASQYLRTDRPMMRSQGPESLRNRVDSDLRFGEPGIGRASQPIMPRLDFGPPRPAPPVSQTPEESLRQRALAGNRRGTGLGMTPNIRPTMNVGKATGGPVGIHSGIASLVGRR